MERLLSCGVCLLKVTLIKFRRFPAGLNKVAFVGVRERLRRRLRNISKAACCSAAVSLVRDELSRIHHLVL